MSWSLQHVLVFIKCQSIDFQKYLRNSHWQSIEINPGVKKKSTAQFLLETFDLLTLIRTKQLLILQLYICQYVADSEAGQFVNYFI